MKKLGIFFTAPACMLLLAACGNNGNKPKDPVDSVQAVNKETATANPDAADFVVKAAASGMMEAQLGQVAQQKAASQRVKDFGTMMVNDHTRAGNELKQLAAERNIAIADLVSNDDQKNMAALSQKTGKDFDKAYIKMMVSDHEKAFDLFQKAAKNVKDSAIRAFAQNTLPVLQKHIDSVTALRELYKLPLTESNAPVEP